MAYFIEKNRFEVIKSTHAFHSKHVYAYRCRVIVLERTAYIPSVKLADLVAADLHQFDDDSDAYVSLRGQLHGNQLTFNHFSGGITLVQIQQTPDELKVISPHAHLTG